MAASRYCKKTYVRAYFLHVTLIFLLLVIPRAAASLAFNYQQLGDTGNALKTSGDVYPDQDVLLLSHTISQK